MKPSDSRSRVLARVRKHRRKKRRKALTARRETERIEQQRRSLDLWEMITGERLESLSKATQLAVAAYEADQNRAGREARQRLSEDARGHKKGVWTGARVGEPWVDRLKEQLVREHSYDGQGDLAEMLTVLWAFKTDVARHGQKRKLRLKDGKTKSFAVAYEASPVRLVPSSVFHGKPVFSTGKQWNHRREWFEPRFSTKPPQRQYSYIDRQRPLKLAT